jgi:hypothetical protein
MRTTLRAAAFLSVLALAGFAAPLAGDVQLRLKFAKGDCLRYRTTQSQTIENEMMGTIENETGFVYRADVSDVAADGSAALDLRYEAARMDMGGPAQMHYDSTLTGDAAKKNNANLAKIFGPFLEAKLTMKLDSTGRAIELKGVDAMLAKAFPASDKPNPMDPTANLKEAFNEDSLRRMIEFAVFPSEPIAPGHKWTQTIEQKIPMMGTMKIEMEDTLVAVEDHASQRCAKIGVTGKITLEPAKDSPMQMKLSLVDPTVNGTLYFALDAGRLIEAQTDTTMDMHMEIGGEAGKGMQMDMSVSSSQRTVLIGKDDPIWQ